MDLLECSGVEVIGSPIENRRELQQLSPAICVAALARKLADLDRHLSIILAAGKSGADWRLDHDGIVLRLRGVRPLQVRVPANRQAVTGTARRTPS
jgi:hypothetical protein